MKAARILVAMAAVAVAAAPASAELDLRLAEINHLPNGLTVIMLEDHSFPLVSVQMLYKSGSAAETTGKTGLAHFLEHLAFRGSANFPKARATELIYDSGGEWHGYTAMDQTTYFATMPTEGLDLLLKIEADRMARVTIDPSSIDAEKGAVITELHSYENDPASVLQEAVTRTAIQAHPYGGPMAGYVSDVARLTVDDARAYYASHYAPGNAVLAIVGDFKPAEARKLVAKAFADVPARPVPAPNLTSELPQRGERRTLLHGPVDRQYFQFAYPAPAASSPDFPAFLLLQEILSGGSGLNLHQSDWAPTTPSADGSLLFGAAGDMATWLPPTREPFLFIIGGSIDGKADRVALEGEVDRRLAVIRDKPVSLDRLSQAKAAVLRAVAEDVQTTEGAAHQLAFFEGVGALDRLLSVRQRVSAVSSAGIQRAAQTYLEPDRRTIGWMIPGEAQAVQIGIGDPKPGADRLGSPSSAVPAGAAQLRRLSAGLSAIVQASPLSDTVMVELLLSVPVKGASLVEDLPNLGIVTRGGAASDFATLVDSAVAASKQDVADTEPRSDDPAVRLEQLISAQMGSGITAPPSPLAIIVSGKIDPARSFDTLDAKLGHAAPGKLATAARSGSVGSKLVRERIAKPLAQGAIGYVVEGPALGTREALAWRMLLYVLTHDYSGRLGWSAISDKGLVYHIYSALRTDGVRTWATLSTGVDPDKADAMEAELRAQLARLVSEPPSPAEVDAARNHLLGRDLTAAQSNEELAAKLAREFVETGGLRSHEQLRGELVTVTPADLANAAQAFVRGNVIRVDVGVPAR